MREGKKEGVEMMENILKYALIITVVVLPWIVIGVMDWRRHNEYMAYINSRHEAHAKALNTDDDVVIIRFRDEETFLRIKEKLGKTEEEMGDRSGEGRGD